MVVKQGALTVLDTDKLFDTSPDTGHPECVCSRCGGRIMEMEAPIRMATTNDEGKVDKDSKEIRLCEFCYTGQKFFRCNNDFDIGIKCSEQCGECKDQHNKE